MKEIQPRIICFGELLWDMLPRGKQAGGAPMNVAFHLNRLGLEAYPLTAVGQDEAGEELIAFLKNKDIDTRLIQQNQYPTGKVLVKLNEKNEASYAIESPSAWDFIQYPESEISSFIENSLLVVFGSLACRNKTSRQTLESLLPHARLKICDINLRAPFYDQDIVSSLLAQADWIKINHEELQLISDWFDPGIKAQKDQAALLLHKFPNAEKLLLTRGDQGAAYFDQDGNFYEHPGFSVKVIDTIGSGDSFLAMFIRQYLNGAKIDVALEAACAMGAIVAKHRGATALFDVDQEIKALKTISR